MVSIKEASDPRCLLFKLFSHEVQNAKRRMLQTPGRLASVREWGFAETALTKKRGLSECHTRRIKDVNINCNPPKKIQDVGLWASKMSLGLVLAHRPESWIFEGGVWKEMTKKSTQCNGSENSESQKKWRIGVKTGQKVPQFGTKLWLSVTQNNLQAILYLMGADIFGFRQKLGPWRQFKDGNSHLVTLFATTTPITWV